MPAITMVSPNVLDSGSPAQTLAVQGAGFVAGSVVRVDGAARPTEFLGSDALRVTVPAADLATPRTLAITVVNPAPGGGASDPAFVQVRHCCFDLLFEGTVAGRPELLALPLGRGVPWTETEPTWAPHGLVLAYARLGAGGAGTIRLVASGQGPVWINSPELGSGRRPAWSPDGSRIAFTVRQDGRGEIATMEPDGSSRTVYTFGNGFGGGTNPGRMRAPR